MPVDPVANTPWVVTSAPLVATVVALAGDVVPVELVPVVVPLVVDPLVAGVAVGIAAAGVIGVIWGEVLVVPAIVIGAIRAAGVPATAIALVMASAAASGSSEKGESRLRMAIPPGWINDWTPLALLGAARAQGPSAHPVLL